MSTDDQIETALWSDLPPPDSFPAAPPLLAHYTSIAAFESIVKRNEIWFSNPLYMNDWEELRFGMSDCAPELLFHDGVRSACRDEKTHNKLASFFEHYLKEFESKHAFDTYVLCLSKHDEQDMDGRLSMWRGYGGNGSGVALLLNTNAIPSTEDPLLIVSQVEYGTRDQRLEWIKDKLDKTATVMKKIELTDPELSNIAYQWIERIKLFSLFSKHSGFREEAEWRLVYMPDRDKKGLFTNMLDYEITPRGVAPKLKIKLEPLPSMPGTELSLELLLNRIILGPTTSSVMAAKSVARMLERAKCPTLVSKIATSTIPLRA